MAHYAFVIDGYTFPDFEEPALGPVTYYQPRKYSVMTPIGSSAVDADIVTFLGLGSQKWTFVCRRASSATITKLLAVYNAGVAVNFKTPQDLTGVNLLLTTPFEIEEASASGYLMTTARFGAIRRA